MRRLRVGLLLALVVGLAFVGVALADGSGNVQVNEPQVAGVSGSNLSAVFPTNKQNEPTIAVDPTDASKLIAGSNDEQLQPPCGPGTDRGADALASDCSFFPNVGTDGVYTSSTGGATWTNHGLLPGFSDGGGSLVSDGDPGIVFGPRPDGQGGFSFDGGARAYYMSLASYASGAGKGQQAPELLTVSTSNDDGASWSAPVVAANGHGFIFNDKPAIWADRNPDSPYFGRVYISWTQFRDLPGCAEPIMFAYSADGGQTWTRPRQVTAAYNCGLGGRQGSVIRTGPDGSVYLAFESSDKTGSIQAIVVSHNGGRSFTRPIKVAGVTDLADPIPGSNFRTNSYPSMGVDQTSGAVYLAWADAGNPSGQGRIVVSKSSDGGYTWSTPAQVSTAAEGYAFYQGLDVAPDGRIDIGYQAQTATDTSTYGTGNASINSFYVKSTDEGSSWSSPAEVSTASSDPAASAQNDLTRQFWGDYNTLVSTNSDAWFIYTDSRNGVGCPAVDTYQQGIDAGSQPTKPAPCSGQFGNTDIYVSIIPTSG